MKQSFIRYIFISFWMVIPILSLASEDEETMACQLVLVYYLEAEESPVLIYSWEKRSGDRAEFLEVVLRETSDTEVAVEMERNLQEFTILPVQRKVATPRFAQSLALVEQFFGNAMRTSSVSLSSSDNFPVSSFIEGVGRVTIRTEGVAPISELSIEVVSALDPNFVSRTETTLADLRDSEFPGFFTFGLPAQVPLSFRQQIHAIGAALGEGFHGWVYVSSSSESRAAFQARKALLPGGIEFHSTSTQIDVPLEAIVPLSGLLEQFEVNPPEYRLWLGRAKDTANEQAGLLANGFSVGRVGNLYTLELHTEYDMTYEFHIEVSDL